MTTPELSKLPPTISIEEAALLLGISRSAAYRAAKAGQLVTSEWAAGGSSLPPLSCGCSVNERQRL
jgi:hypothetical protein